MKARGATARGVDVIDEKTPDGDLDAMDRAGVRGVRINLATVAQNDPEAARRRVQATAARIRRLGWHIQIYANVELIPALKDLILGSPLPFVFDHFGGTKAALGLDQPGFGDLVELLRSGHAYVKLSGAYRASTQADYRDAVPLAKALIGANPDRAIWGTDWPHPDTAGHAGHRPTDITPLLQIDDGRLLNQLPAWAPDPAVRKKILVDNPARLYGFSI